MKNDTIFEEIRNRIMMNIWSIIPSSPTGLIPAVLTVQ